MFDLIGWLRLEALPLWGITGFDKRSGLFHEQLDFVGRPIETAPRRLMVQARQIFVYAAAEMSGWFDGAVLAEQAGDTMLLIYGEGDGRAGFAFSATASGTVHNNERDLYAQAFALFALAWLTRLTGRRRYLDAADATLAFLDAQMAVSNTGGYAETLFRPSVQRRQNPHMHLLEALLALHDVARGRGYLERAASLVDFAIPNFFHGSKPALVELYDGELRPFHQRPFRFEPGHHFEWSWLLARFAGMTGQPIPQLASDLYASAAATIASDGTIADVIDETGRVCVGSTRLWPHTEAARAATLPLAMDGDNLRERVLDTLARRFLHPAHRGCWIDHCDAAGQTLCHFVPASSLYHLVGAACAIDECPRHTGC